MNKVKIELPVDQATQQAKQFLEEKGFTIVANIEQKANDAKVDIELAASQLSICGNP